MTDEEAREKTISLLLEYYKTAKYYIDPDSGECLDETYRLGFDDGVLFMVKIVVDNLLGEK